MADIDAEAHLRELNRAALALAHERRENERTLVAAREQLETARAELPVAERTAKTRRQSQLDAVRGRADLERRLQNLIETEALARTRRQQAEQRAQGFRAAATFAASGRHDGGEDDAERLERERLVEARAIREAGVAESRASEEHAEELKIGKLRAELEMHVAAEREVESNFAFERETAEKRSVELQHEIARLAAEIEDVEIALEGLAEAAETIASERAALAAEYGDQRRATRESVEVRIEELRRLEADAIRERTDLEKMLAELTASDAAEDLSLADAATAQSAQEDAIAQPAAMAAAVPAPAEVEEIAKTPLFVTRPTLRPGQKPKAAESFIRPAERPRTAPTAAKAGDDEELIPGLKSLVGNIFTRKRPELPVAATEAEESSSIADRIARDFGLLGASPEEPA